MEHIVSSVSFARVIRAPVGSGGRNLRGDVRLVQFILSDWRVRHRMPAIAIDGLSGPQTVGAIGQFQRQRFGFADGRCDPGGPTIAALGADHLGNMLEAWIDPTFAGTLSAAAAMGLPTGALGADSVSLLADAYWATIRQDEHARPPMPLPPEV